jgi:hypothetical protein
VKIHKKKPHKVAFLFSCIIFYYSFSHISSERYVTPLLVVEEEEFPASQLSADRLLPTGPAPVEFELEEEDVLVRTPFSYWLYVQTQSFLEEQLAKAIIPIAAVNKIVVFFIILNLNSLTTTNIK